MFVILPFMQKLFIIIFATLFLTVVSTQTIFAQTPTPTCHPLYGGGVTTQTTCSVNPTATPVPTVNMNEVGGKGGGGGMAQPTLQPTIPPTSKGGLPVYQSPQVNEMPSSGPEVLVLGALPALGALGFYLRRKQPHSTKI